MLRLNVAIPPSGSPNANGILGGDLAGFPNGRRVFDDIVTIELRAIAGLTIPLVSPSYVPDGAAKLVADGSAPTTAELPDGLPVPRSSGQRLGSAAAVGGVMSGHHHHDHGDHFVGGGAAVLDIGGDVGALLALMDADAEGTELHVRADRQHRHGAHRSVDSSPGQRARHCRIVLRVE